MRPSAKRGGGGAPAETSRSSVNRNLETLHRRFYDAFNLGRRVDRENWYCADIEVQKLVLRSIEAFLDCIAHESLQQPLIKESLTDMVKAVDSILEFKSQSILTLATGVAGNMIKILPSPMLQSHHALNLIHPLADMLASQQLQVAISCATALNTILSKLRVRQEMVVWEILKERKAAGHLVQNVNQYFNGNKPIEYLEENASALSKILLRWPSFRYCVWNCSDFSSVLVTTKFASKDSVKVSVLQLFSNLVLCHNGAVKLLENGEQLLQMMMNCMSHSNTHPVRKEAFKLARNLALSRSGCLKMMGICREHLVKVVISAMRSECQESIVVEACSLVSSLTRWPGDHHLYFWREGVDRILVDLLVDDYNKIHQLHHESPVEDLITVVQQSFDGLIYLRSYIWDILGMLAANFPENIKFEMRGDEFQLKILVLCACLSFADSTCKLRQVSHTTEDMTSAESAARVVLMIVNSPSNSIAELSRYILGEIIKSNGPVYADYFLQILNTKLSGNEIGRPGDLQDLVCLMSLACYCSLPEYQKMIIRHRGLKTMVAYIRWWLTNPTLIKRSSILRHLHREKLCCFPMKEEWEGEEIILLLSLWILAQLLSNSSHGEGHPLKSLQELHESGFILILQDICSGSYSPGCKWYAAYVLSFLGFFGFPSKLGNKIGRSLGQSDHSDMKLILANEDDIYVHEIILRVMCPSLLPPVEPVNGDRLSSEPTVKRDFERKSMKVVRLSAQVERQPLSKIVEYLYLGYLQACEDLVKKLKIFARHCKLEGLTQMLSRKNPTWGSPIPNFDLRPALGPAGVNSSDILLEANSTQLSDWKCNNCSALNPHLHVHKVIVESSCEYLRALFQSGMQESNTHTIKVPDVSWESLNKLVGWFYSNQLPVPSIDCLWYNMDLEEKRKEVQQYLELCWISEYWFIEDLNEECFKAVKSCLKSSPSLLSAKLIQVAANLSQWKLARIAANCMAPVYHHLRVSGELDAVDDNLVEMVRAASVLILQQRGGNQLSSYPYVLDGEMYSPIND